MTRPLLLLALLPPIYAGQTVSLVPTAPRPLINIAKPLSVAEIDVTDVDFLEPRFGHGGIDLVPLEGEPVAGKEYVVEARIYGENAMAHATFEVLDESGRAIQALAMGRKPEVWTPRFLGMMTVPQKSFRIALSGEATDGRPFRRVSSRLVRPLDRALVPNPQPEMLPAEAQEFRRLIDAAGADAVRAMKEFTEDYAATVIVMPRVVVSNVTYAPLLSAAGRPLGLRVTYDAEFSAPGMHNPELRVEAEYPPATRPGVPWMRVVNSSITPLPREAYQPWKEAAIDEDRRTLLQSTAQYIYQERTVYHFTAELVPDFIGYTRDHPKGCIYWQQYVHSPDEHAALMKILNSDAPGSYRLTIRSTAGFVARIANVYGEGTLYRNFEAEGFPDCGVLF